MEKILFWARNLLLLCFIVFCSSNGWAWNTVYLIGQLTGNNWDNNQKGYAFTNSSEDGKSYYEVSVIPGTTYYFAVYIDHYNDRRGPNTPDADIKQNASDENYHKAYDNENSWQITPTTNKIKIWSNQKEHGDETPWIWVDEIGSSETKYTINISAGEGGTVSTSSVSVGSTPVSITATPDGGYRFKNWTVTGGASVGSTTSATTTLTATSAGTVTANFELSSTPTPTPSNTDYAYYLVGNFFDDDPANAINYDRRYFKFNIQSNGKYMVEIPAAVTARAQIIGVTDQGYYKFGPSGATNDIKWDWPVTDGSATGTFAEKGTTNYWNLTTRNNNTVEGDDDGLYEVWFELDASGNPSQWSFKHVSTKRVAYFLSTAPGATANPVYNSRNDVNAAFSNKTYAMVYIDPAQTYYTIGYVLKDKEWAYISKATAYDAHVNRRNESILPTTNKLFLMGNNGRTFLDHNPYNEVSPHVAAIKVNDKQAGLYKVEYNPSNGNDEWAKGIGNGQDDDEKNTVGIRGQFMFIGGTDEDSPIASISMVGNAIPGTTNGDGTWDWESTAGDMTYDENEGCYKLTIQTTASENTANQFRFVANHDYRMTWYEDGTTDAKKARVPYLGTGNGHSCMPTDPNPVAYTVTDNTDDTGVNIIFNRPAGTWTVRFYIDINEQGQKSYRYTITGKESLDIPLTYCYNKFIRTYSNNIAMDLTDDVKAYIAYKFVPAENSEKYGKCKVYLRQMDYIPANVGVVLVGKVPAGGSYSEGYPLNFSLQKRVDAVPEDLRYVWTKHDTYIAREDKWHNFLVPTVNAVNDLGNAEVNGNGDIIYRYFGLSSYYNTAYYKSTQTGENYIGFFRLTENGKSGANKAYLRIPSSKNTDVSEYDKETYGVLDFNAQLSGQETDEDGHPHLAKAMIFFDDEDIDDNTSTGITTIKDNIVKDNVYYNMQGIRVVNPTKGMYIINGKKILVK